MLSGPCPFPREKAVDEADAPFYRLDEVPGHLHGRPRPRGGERGGAPAPSHLPQTTWGGFLPFRRRLPPGPGEATRRAGAVPPVVRDLAVRVLVRAADERHQL